MKITLNLCLLGLAAVATAQDLTSRDGTLQASVGVNQDLRVRREEEINVFELKQLIEQVSNAVGTLQYQSGATAGQSDLLTTLAERAINEAQSVAVKQATMQQTIDGVGDVVSALSTGVTNQLSTANSNLNSALATAQASIAAQMSSQNSTMNARLSTITASTSAASSSLTSTLTTQMAQMNSTITATVATGLASKKDSKMYIWAGGCSNSPGSGWRWYCLDRTWKDTSRGRFTKHDNTYLRATVHGWFRFNSWAMGVASGWQHAQLEVNGKTIYYSYDHTAGCWWGSVYIDQTFIMMMNQKVRARYYSNCSHAYHGGGWETGYHSRVMMEWAAPLEA